MIKTIVVMLTTFFWLSQPVITKAQGPGQEIISLNLEGVSLRSALRLLTAKLGKNLLVDAQVAPVKLDMSLDNITAADAFNAILESNALSFREMEGNVYFVATASKIGKQTIVKEIRCKYAYAKDLAEVLKSMVGSEFGAIMSDERTNTLIIKESPDIIASMEKLIVELDRPTQQVYIQAEIVEISTTDNNEFGIEWLWKTANIGSVDGQVGTDFSLQASGNTSGETSTSSNVDNSFPFPTSSGLGVGILNSDVEAVLHALGETNNLNLLSRPRLVTMDNQESVIEVGDQIPFRKLNEFGVTSTEFKDATVQLVVKPHIVDSEYIMMKVSPKADFANGFTPDGTPIISTRNASTNVKIRNGQTLVIGGLIRDSQVHAESKVPVLGDIPLLGYLFKNSKSTKTKTQLIVFITPIILQDDTGDIFDDDLKLRDKTINQ